MVYFKDENAVHKDISMLKTLLVPKLQLGNVVFEAPASRDAGTSRSLQYMGSKVGVWEPAK